MGMNFIGGDFIETSGELNTFKYLKNMKIENPIIFDVGANIGDYTNAAQDYFNDAGIIYCFEPSQTTFKILSSKLKSSKVKLYNFGFGDRTEIRTLYSNRDGSGQASIYSKRLELWNTDDIKELKTSQIQLYTLDDFCRTNNISHINLLKLDVEGNEIPILKGAQSLLKSNSIDMIQFEFGTCNIFSKTYFNDFYNILNSNYKLYRILYAGLYPIEYYSALDEIFLSANYLAINISKL